jgi:two-component system chemotaxis response regulator CheY
VKKILVIDDSETIRQQVKQALATTGYEIIEAVDGIDGLEKLRAVIDLDLALCDVNMPRMNGLDMIAEVRARRARRAGS